MIAPHRSNRKKPPTQDGRRLRRFLRRWLELDESEELPCIMFRRF
jgi:hypothetical protein